MQKKTIFNEIRKNMHASAVFSNAIQETLPKNQKVLGHSFEVNDWSTRIPYFASKQWPEEMTKKTVIRRTGEWRSHRVTFLAKEPRFLVSRPDSSRTRTDARHSEWVDSLWGTRQSSTMTLERQSYQTKQPLGQSTPYCSIHAGQHTKVSPK